jgi:hypothetical protein
MFRKKKEQRLDASSEPITAQAALMINGQMLTNPLAMSPGSSANKSPRFPKQEMTASRCRGTHHRRSASLSWSWRLFQTLTSTLSGLLGGVQKKPAKPYVVHVPRNMFEDMTTQPGSSSDPVWISFVSLFASID